MTRSKRVIRILTVSISASSQALSEGIVELLQRGAAENITTIQEFINGLQRVATQHGWQFSDYYTNPATSQAREQMRAGLQRLRQADRSMCARRAIYSARR